MHMVGYAASGRIQVGVQLGADPEPGPGGPDEVDHHLMTDEWFATPVPADGREQTTLDLISSTGSGRQVAYRDLQARLVCQFLKLQFPQEDPIAVAAYHGFSTPSTM